MTAIPDPTKFVERRQASVADGAAQPKVTQHFWGCEVRPSVEIITIATLMRLFCGILAMASALAAFGVWLLPAMAFVTQATVSKATVAIALALLAIVSARIAARGTVVRVQVDTFNGELREVVDGPFGSTIVLAKYGFDAVARIDLVSKRGDPAFGQIQVGLHNGQKVPVGDGVLVALNPLRDRLARECGLGGDTGTQADAEAPIWAGPLAA